uniref:Germ cell associated 1 n=1 Tax=Hippocampus comes TaxID=109280 RepID=A0A3Q2XVD7_HIPCM
MKDIERCPQMRSPALSFIQTVVSLCLAAMALTSSYWCVGKQKVPKPLCSPTKHSKCIPVPGLSNSSSVQLSWETGDDRFVFPVFHTGLFVTCEENIYTDEKCRGFYTLTPSSERGDLHPSFWAHFKLLVNSFGCFVLLFSLSHDVLLNAFAAVFTVLGGLLGMVGHMMFMQVFQTTVSMGPEDFKPHSYGYSWAFYVAWFAFTVCMSAGVSTLNNYTKNVLMVGARLNSSLNPFNFVGLLPPAPYFSAPNSGMVRAFHQSHAPISHLSPYYEQPPSKSPPPPPPGKPSYSIPLPYSASFPPPSSHLASASPLHRLSLPSPSHSPSSPALVRGPLKGHQENMVPLYTTQDYCSPL